MFLGRVSGFPADVATLARCPNPGVVLPGLRWLQKSCVCVNVKVELFIFLQNASLEVLGFIYSAIVTKRVLHWPAQFLVFWLNKHPVLECSRLLGRLSPPRA